MPSTDNAETIYHVDASGPWRILINSKRAIVFTLKSGDCFEGELETMGPDWLSIKNYTFEGPETVYIRKQDISAIGMNPE